jgi:hypothetical protein
MSLKQDLKNLEQQKQQEFRNLHATYLRTKRDVKRAASPSRFIRRNIGASLGVATVLGLLLAPRPAPKIKESPAPKEKGPGILGNLASIVRKALGTLEEKIPTPHETAKERERAKKKAESKGNSLLKMLLTMLVSRVDLTRLISELSKHVVGRVQNSMPHNGHEPEVSVADAGTVRPNDFEEHFE